MLSIRFSDIYIYILVFVRLAGVIGFNPIFSQKGVPVKIKAALVFLVTIIMAPQAISAAPKEVTYGTLVFVFAMIKELFVGFLFSYVISIFYYLLLGAGEILDTQFGLSMAKVFDPGTNIQMAVSDKLLNMFFIMYFFVTNSHLLMFRMIYASYDIIPAGVPVFMTENITAFAVEIFISTFSLVMRLTFPFIAVQFILQICLGILMKLIPQIHVFVINMDLKILLTIVMLIVMAQPIGNFIDDYIEIMFRSLQDALYSVSGGST